MRIVHYHQHRKLEAFTSNNGSTDLNQFLGNTRQPQDSATKLLDQEMDHSGLASSGSTKYQSVAIEVSTRVFYRQPISIQTNTVCQLNTGRRSLRAIDFADRIFWPKQRTQPGCRIVFHSSNLQRCWICWHKLMDSVDNCFPQNSVSSSNLHAAFGILE
jgi:hypothetical protein